MSVALRDREAAQEVIRVFTGIKDLRIISLSTQVRLPRMVAHDAILDVVAEDSIGRVYNIEVQRADNLDHVRRVRYYCAMLDMAWLEKGGSYEELPDLYMIYLIKESDPMDQSHGALSKRVHYLKCEERTWVWQRRTSPRRCTQTLHR